MKNHQQASNYSLLVRELNVVRNAPLLKEAQKALVATNRDNLHGVVVLQVEKRASASRCPDWPWW